MVEIPFFVNSDKMKPRMGKKYEKVPIFFFFFATNGYVLFGKLWGKEGGKTKKGRRGS